MKVGEKMNFGRLATIFQICTLDAKVLLNCTEMPWTCRFNLLLSIIITFGYNARCHWLKGRR